METTLLWGLSMEGLKFLTGVELWLRGITDAQKPSKTLSTLQESVEISVALPAFSTGSYVQ